MAFGLLPTGFVKKTTQDIIDELRADQLDQIDSALNTQPETPIGQFNGIMASKMAEIWDLMEAVNSAQNPDNASDFALDGVSALTGTLRAEATKGTVTLTLELGAGVIVPAGVICAVAGDPNNRWVTLEDAVTFAVPAFIDVEAEAEQAGNIPANAGTISVIVTPIGGWYSVTNAFDADPGEDIDTDPELRIRRIAELSKAGSTTLPAIRADLLDVEGVTSVSVFHNPRDYQVGSLPAHSVEAVVLGGVDQDIADQLYRSVAGGIRTFGTTTKEVETDDNQVLDFSFSRPDEIDIYLEIDLDIDAGEYPAAGDALIKAALKAYGDENYQMGSDVILSLLYCPINDAAIGIVDITEIRVGDGGPLQTTNWIIGDRELAVLDTTRITVNTTPV